MDNNFWSLLEKMIEERYINVQKHPDADLYIYNYSAQTQFEWFWNEATLACRGLILDADKNIVARPLKKFFNLEEKQLESIPDEAFEIYEKMDGSLGILYFIEDQAFIATRGSFTSEQAQRATIMLNEKYKDSIALLRRDCTYLFEIIYPENRIVVHYGDKEELTLLAIVDKATGKELPLEDIGFPIVKRYQTNVELHELAQLEEDNREGFVVKFESGFRVKVKFEEYKRLHHILTNVSSKVIWEHLSENRPIKELIEEVPDEFYDWVKETEQELRKAFHAIEDECKQTYKELSTRKETAAYFLTCKYPRVLFAMLDKKDYHPIIWRLVQPEYEKPFSQQK